MPLNTVLYFIRQSILFRFSPLSGTRILLLIPKFSPQLLLFHSPYITSVPISRKTRQDFSGNNIIPLKPTDWIRTSKKNRRRRTLLTL